MDSFGKWGVSLPTNLNYEILKTMKSNTFFIMKFLKGRRKRIYIPDNFTWKIPLISMIITGGLMLITLILI